VLIIGGGAGAAHAVEALREEGYTGSIRVVSKEPHLPGDRTKISKALISDPNKLLLRSQAFYDKLKAQFILDTVRPPPSGPPCPRLHLVLTVPTPSTGGDQA